MRDIVKKMCNKVPCSFNRFQVFLAADVTVSTLYLGVAVETIPLPPFF